MAGSFTDDGESIGFDGSYSIGSEGIFMHLQSIFKDHPTARFISKVKDVQMLRADIVVLWDIAGMIPPQQSDINPKSNTLHTLIVVKVDGD